MAPMPVPAVTLVFVTTAYGLFSLVAREKSVCRMEAAFIVVLLVVVLLFAPRRKNCNANSPSITLNKDY